MQKLILASQSYARKTMLENAGVTFEAQRAMIDEVSVKSDLLDQGIFARDLSDRLADLKARSVSLLNPDNYVIGSDQVLECEGCILSKVDNLVDAKAKLKFLQGKTHTLFSAAILYHEGKPVWRYVDGVKLTMHDMDGAAIDRYFDKVGDDVLNSVGCYHIEAKGIQLFSNISGDYFTILGMPLLPLLTFLKLHKLGGLI